jgi:hypothetical protein
MKVVFERSKFQGENWDACVRAFLAYPGIMVMGRNFATRAPASFFVKLNKERAINTMNQANTEFLRSLEGLGEQHVQQLIATDSDTRMSWSIFLDADLQEVLTFRGLPLLDPGYTSEQDWEDLTSGTVVGSLVTSLINTRITKIDHTPIGSPIVELTSPSGQRYGVTFTALHSLTVPAAEHEEISQIDEVLGTSGRTWFVFRPATLHPGLHQMVAQAESAEWTVLDD